MYEQSLARERVRYYPSSLSILWTMSNDLRQLNLHSLSLRSRTPNVPTDFSMIMAPTEMVHCDPPIYLPPTNTPPNSPGRPDATTFNDEEAIEVAPSLATETAMVAPSPPTPHHSSLTSLSSQVAREFAQQVVEALRSLGTNQAPLSAATAEVESKEPPVHPSELDLEMTRLEFKTVDERYVPNSEQVPVG